MNPSRPFILRPVATSLLMAAILLVGVVAFVQLPVSALPEVDYPTIQVLTFYPGASPDVMATTVTAPLERQFGEMQGLSQMTSTSAGGRLRHRSPVQPCPRSRCRRRRSPVFDECVADFPAVRPARRRRFTTKPTPPTRPCSPSRSLPTPCRFRRWRTWSIPGWLRASPSSPASAWFPSAAARSRPSASRSTRSSFLPTASTWRTCVPPWSQSSVNSAKGNFDGPRQDYQIDANDQITSADGLQEHCCLLLQRRAGLAQECRRRGQRGGKHQAGRVDEPDARRHPQHPAPARRQHHHRGRPHPANPAAA